MGMTAVSELPAPIQEFIDATNRGDTEALLAAFAEDAYLSDWGRVFNGHAGIANWNQTDNIGKQAHFDLVSFREVEGGYGVTLKVSGNGYNGTGEMIFTLAGEKIARLVI
jgi:ketosteroid isomerase-like protein